MIWSFTHHECNSKLRRAYFWFIIFFLFLLRILAIFSSCTVFQFKYFRFQFVTILIAKLESRRVDSGWPRFLGWCNIFGLLYRKALANCPQPMPFAGIVTHLFCAVRHRANREIHPEKNDVRVALAHIDPLLFTVYFVTVMPAISR